MRARSDPDRPAGPSDDWAGCSRLLYGTVHTLIALVVNAQLIRVRVRGVENLPAAGPVLIMSNHQSNLDPFLIGWAVPRPISIPAKVELFRNPILACLLRRLGSYPVDRSIADAGSLRRGLKMLRQGKTVAVFPEATRSRTGELGAFGTTLTRVAMRGRIPIVLVAVAGSGQALPPGRAVPRFGAVVGICFGEVVELSPGDARQPTDEAVLQATAEIRATVGRLYDEAMRMGRA